MPSEKYQRGKSSRHVVDAHLLDEGTIVVGYDQGPVQVSCIVLNKEVSTDSTASWRSLIQSSQRPYRVDLVHKGHTTVIEHRHAGTSSPNPGISVLAPLPAAAGGQRRFLSGGHDGTVRMWDLTQGQGRNLQATSAYLSLSPGEAIGCLAYRQSSDEVLAGHARHISRATLGAYKAPRPVLLSAPPQQIHIHPQNPHVVILEVRT